MHKPMSMFVIALTLAGATAAMAQTADVTGRVMRVDPGTQVIVLDNNQAFRVTPNTMLIVNGQPVAIGSLQPGQSVVIRSGEAVAMTPSTSAPVTQPGVTQPGVTVQPAQPGSTDRKSTRLNSSHSQISYAVFCLKKKRPSVNAELLIAGGSALKTSAS